MNIRRWIQFDDGIGPLAKIEYTCKDGEVETVSKELMAMMQGFRASRCVIVDFKDLRNDKGESDA